MLLTPLIISLGLASTSFAQSPPAQLYSPLVPGKILAATNALPASIQYPQFTTTAGRWRLFAPDTWTSGFHPATLYALHQRTKLCGATNSNGLGAADWLALGRSTSAALASLTKRNSVGHDVGFLSFPYVDELKLNPNNQTAARVVNEFATFLANRFSPIVGCTRSWDSADPNFQVIIDNMMNLEVLFVSAALTGNHTLIDIANSHATTTMNNHIRSDGSTWHVIEYDSTNGRVTKRRTAQGYSDSSTWTRGQAWGVYGFAMMYQRTQNPDYLKTSRRLAEFFLNNMPADDIVPWDFNAPVANRPADSSAATLMATGLLLLAQVENNPANVGRWTSSAIHLLNAITALAWNEPWDSLLSNGTVSRPANNYLTGTTYGDYYYVVAGNELVSMGLATC